MTSIPENTPAPVDDGACDHLKGQVLPNVTLTSSEGRPINVGGLAGTVVLYFYPRTGRPDRPSPDGWAQIPGALGCTPQACAFRDHHRELTDLGVQVFGVSTQDSGYQQEAVDRLGISFELLSDENLALAQALELPLFTVEGVTLNKRVTLIAKDGEIQKVFYPVFPPDDHVYEVIDWLKDSSR